MEDENLLQTGGAKFGFTLPLSPPAKYSCALLPVENLSA